MLAEVGQGIYEAESRTAETTTPMTGGRRCLIKLADKGPIKPPPALKGLAQLVSQEIQSWPGIVAATHWFASRLFRAAADMSAPDAHS